MLILGDLFNDIRKQVEKVLCLPNGSTDPKENFPFPGRPPEVLKKIQDEITKRRMEKW